MGLAVGQSSLSDEISELIEKPMLEASICDPEDFMCESRSKVDILVATPGRLMDHINNTKGFTLEHLCYLVRGCPSLTFFSSFYAYINFMICIFATVDGSFLLIAWMPG